MNKKQLESDTRWHIQQNFRNKIKKLQLSNLQPETSVFIFIKRFSIFFSSPKNSIQCQIVSQLQFRLGDWNELGSHTSWDFFFEVSFLQQFIATFLTEKNITTEPTCQRFPSFDNRKSLLFPSHPTENLFPTQEHCLHS